jgi:hypothetical protein
MFEILITGADMEMKSIITEEQLKEIIRLLETSQHYRLEHLHRIDNGVAGEELLDILKREVKPDNLING